MKCLDNFATGKKSNIAHLLEEERFELLVCSVHLVYEKDCRVRTIVFDRLQQRSIDQVFATEKGVFFDRRACALGHPDTQQLTRVVPFIERLRGINSLEALQAD